MKLIFSFLLAGYMMAFPGTCLSAAREAMELWARAVAPALFPFMALLPVMSGVEARRAYRAIAAKPMRVLFRLPSEAAASVVVGLIAGSPAGDIAVSRAYRDGEIDGQQAFTAGVLASGCGPVFLVCSVGTGMFENAMVGVKILASMWLALGITGMIVARLPFSQENVGRAANHSQVHEPSAIKDAALGVITVCGYMVLFRVIGSALPGIVQPYLEVSAGCAGAAQTGMETLAAFLCGFGGVCAGCQNVGALADTGVKTIMFFGAKLVCGALCAGIYRTLSHLSLPEISISGETMVIASEIALGCAVFLMTLKILTEK